MNSLKNNLDSINEILERNNSIAEIIAVCKKQPIEKVQEVVSLGINNLGVNYINEFEDFKSCLTLSSLKWHYIGSIQSKKLNKIVGNFDIIHSVSQMKTVRKIDKIAGDLGIIQKIFFQLNLSNEPSKSGFNLVEYQEAISSINGLNNIFLCGLMTMPPLGEGGKYFKELLKIKKEFKDSGQSSLNCDIKYLSMGTSGDFEDAVKCGATHIRLGTVLMGQRI